MSAVTSGSHSIILIIPTADPITAPVGPYKLSIQPGTGSFFEPKTKIITKSFYCNYFITFYLCSIKYLLFIKIEQKPLYLLMLGLTTATGICFPYFLTRSSATALVYIYVFGRPSNRLKQKIIIFFVNLDYF